MTTDQRPQIPRQSELHHDRMCTCAMHCASSEHHERAWAITRDGQSIQEIAAGSPLSGPFCCLVCCTRRESRQLMGPGCRMIRVEIRDVKREAKDQTADNIPLNGAGEPRGAGAVATTPAGKDAPVDRQPGQRLGEVTHDHE